jgi:hypothetical protein
MDRPFSLRIRESYSLNTFNFFINTSYIPLRLIQTPLLNLLGDHVNIDTDLCFYVVVKTVIDTAPSQTHSHITSTALEKRLKF